MITLATLETATEQQVFDQVATHLLTQMETSQGIDPDEEMDSVCLYRSGTLKCAAGCLIADTEYKAEFENKSFFGVLSLIKGVPEFSEEDDIPTSVNEKLVMNLQKIHDGYSPEAWQEELERLASHRSLSFN